MKAVIFDMDGVLVETDHLFEHFVSNFLKKLGVEAPPDIDRYRGMTSQDQWKILKRKLGLKLPVKKLVTEAREKYLGYLESIPHIEAVDGVTQLIKELSVAKIKMAVASSANPVRMKKLLKRVGIDSAFGVMISADDVARGKPAPDCFLLAAKKMDVLPTDCVVIEDAERGILAARAAGMKCVGYKGSSENQDDLRGSDVIINSFRDLTLTKLRNL